MRRFPDRCSGYGGRRRIHIGIFDPAVHHLVLASGAPPDCLIGIRIEGIASGIVERCDHLNASSLWNKDGFLTR